MNKIFRPFVLALSTLLLQGSVSAQSNGFEVIKSLELMDNIHQNLEKFYVDVPNTGRISKVAIDAMLKELDPYTVYYHESNMEDFRLMTTGQYGGIGAVIRKIGEYVFIAEPYEGNPADKAGVRAGDKILSIDGKDMRNKPSDEVSSSLKGPKGTTIQLKVLRGDKELTLPITRDEIKIPDVPFSGMMNNTVGYIRLSSFTQTASTEVKKAFMELKDKGMKELIFDLRGNGGGLLIEAVRIVNLFVEKDQMVVNTKGRVEEENRVYKTTEAPMDLNIPLVVLVDGGSASASEIVAGSLQDLDRAVIVGQTSFGKGLVQRTYDLKYGSKIKLTIAKYYTPSGRCVQKLDYYEKNAGKKAKEIPDSLIKIFHTKNGREVIDARGIEPDVKVEEREFSRLTAMLIVNNLVFNYTNQYYDKHPTIAPAGEFRLSDADYEDFKKMVVKDTFDYNTASEEELKKVRKIAEEEGYFSDMEDIYKQMMAKVTPSKERDLEKFKKEIKQIIENEIVARYYYQKGRAQDSFKEDDALQKALTIINDKAVYSKILKP